MKANWQTKKLGQVCERVTVGHVGITSPYYREAGILFLRTQNVGKSSLILHDVRFVTPEFHASLRKSAVKSGDVLMSRVITDTVNCALIPPTLGPANCANVVLIRPGPQLLPEFLVYYIQSPEAQRHLLDHKVGSAQLVVNTTVAREWPILLPPLAEQKRIVGILDKAFAALATAKANTEKNLQNGRALLERYLSTLFDQPNGNHKTRPLISLCSFFTDSAHRTPKYDAAGIPALRPRDVVNGRLNLREVARVSKAEYEIQTKRHRPAPGDIVYSRELSYGWAVILPKSPPVCLSQGMCIFRPSAEVEPVYLLHMLNGPVGRQQAQRAAVGAAHPHINLSDIKSYAIPVLPIPEQRKIAKNLADIQNAAMQIQRCCESKYTKLDELKKSLLHEAFNGRL